MGVKNKNAEILDRAGMFVSALCAIHCAMIPILAIASPVLYSLFDNPTVHIIFMIFVLPLGIAAFYLGYRHHRDLSILMTGIIGLSVVVISIMIHEDILTVIGSSVLIYSHYKNRKSCVCHKH